MEVTLDRDLRSIGILYEWYAQEHNESLDDALEAGRIPETYLLSSLATFLRVRSTHNGKRVIRLSSVAVTCKAIRKFLEWAVDPRNLGRSSRVPMHLLNERKTELREAFRNLESSVPRSERIPPLKHEDEALLRTVVGPVREADGKIRMPLVFDTSNPFKSSLRLRNWLMVEVARQCGLRKGELLKIRLDDLPKQNDVGLKVRRRPFDQADSRRYRPRVKTVERALPISAEVSFGLRAYLTSRAPQGRSHCKTPYLFVSENGNPLSVSATNDVICALRRSTDLGRLTWHALRHTWAENIAMDLVVHNPQDRAWEILRELGGWKPGSPTPFHYVQNAMKAVAMQFLSTRNSLLYRDQEN